MAPETVVAMSDGTLVNFAHLEHLSEEVIHEGQAHRIVHIYCPAPDYQRVADPQEGVACVDDVGRAAVVYLRHFELTGDGSSGERAEAMLRFILYMQAPGGLFHNFVFNRRLEINRTHPRSVADAPGWWTARAVWALGTAARALRPANPAFSRTCAEAVRRVLPHLDRVLGRYPQTIEHCGRTVPIWLLNEDGADATSELLLGLIALRQAEPDAALSVMIQRFAEGISRMRYGSMSRFPFGLHASNRHGWHKWGNSQTLALAEAGFVDEAQLEAEQFYPRLLVEGFLHSIDFDAPGQPRSYEHLASGVRSVAVGLVRLSEATRDERYAKMAGLAASWLTGNNTADVPMYDPDTGRCFDGLDGETRVNRNAGAESTIEALFSILEVERHPAARRWLFVRADPPVRTARDDCEFLYRVFTAADPAESRRIGIVMDLTHERLEVLEGEALERFLLAWAVPGAK